MSQTEFLDKTRPDQTRNSTKSAVVNRDSPNQQRITDRNRKHVQCPLRHGACAWFLRMLNDDRHCTLSMTRMQGSTYPGGGRTGRAPLPWWLWAHTDRRRGGPRGPTTTHKAASCRHVGHRGLISVAGSQHLLRSKTGFTTHTTPAGASKP